MSSTGWARLVGDELDGGQPGLGVYMGVHGRRLGCDYWCSSTSLDMLQLIAGCAIAGCVSSAVC